MGRVRRFSCIPACDEDREAHRRQDLDLIDMINSEISSQARTSCAPCVRLGLLVSSDTPYISGRILTGMIVFRRKASLRLVPNDQSGEGQSYMFVYSGESTKIFARHSVYTPT